MSLLAPHVREEIEGVLRGLDLRSAAPDQIDVSGRRVFLFTGEDAHAQADQAHIDYIEGGKVPLSGIEEHGGTWYFVT